MSRPSRRAFAASTASSDLAITVADPPLHTDGWSYALSVPVRGGSITGPVRTYGALPETITITNAGTAAATNPTGTAFVDMLDVSGAVPVGGRHQLQIGTTDASWLLTPVAGTTPGQDYTYTYLGVLQPGETVRLPLRYYVASPFSNVASDVTVLVGAAVVDEQLGDRDDTERLGLVPAFDYL